jgi:hypothetical protein
MSHRIGHEVDERILDQRPVAPENLPALILGEIVWPRS